MIFLPNVYIFIPQQRDTSQPDGKAQSARVDGKGATERSKKG